MNYVCADIHGRWDKYQAMLDDLNLGEDDKLYILGDVIDRGEDGIRILQDIMKRVCTTAYSATTRNGRRAG